MKNILPRHSVLSVIFFIALTLVLSSCSQSPTPAAKEYIEQKFQKYSRGYLKLISFKNINGVKSEHRGVEWYRMLYEIEVEVIKDGGWIKLAENGELVPGPNFDEPAYPFSVFDEQCEVESLEEQCKNTQIKKGQKFKGRSTVELVKSANGWEGAR